MSLENTAISRRVSPELIPGYRLESMLGKGGMGEVHRAKQLSLDRTVAVKLLNAELAQDKSFVTRFEKEAAALAALSHPNIVAIVDKGKTEKTYYLVMEFVDGPSLRDVMRSPEFDSVAALRLAFDVCRAIDYAHGRGIIHRDLKPENILVDEQAGRIPKVSDFGLANFIDDAPSKFNLTETHVSMGTQAYMAPEQRMDAKTADHRADLYSLGVILYELLVGEVPVGNFDPPSQRKPGLDPRLDAIVARCLKPIPADRYQKVSELINDLLPLVPVSFSHPPPISTPVERMRWWVRRAVRTTARAISIALVASACGVLGVSWLRSHAPRAGNTLEDALAPELVPLPSSSSAKARITETPEQRKIQIGEGPDHVQLLGSGRDLARSDSTFRFAPPAAQKVGRVLFDVIDVGAHQVEFTAQVKATQLRPSAWSRLRAWALGEQSQPRAAVLLQGTSGRFVAVTLDADGGPATLQWVLGERRGTFLGPPTPPKTRVELVVDRAGALRAFLGSGQDRRELGEPLLLGASWRNDFGKLPNAELACLDGECEMSGLDFVMLRDPPPAPTPEPVPLVVAKPVVHPPPVVAKKPVHVVAKAPVHSKKPVYSASTKKKSTHRR